tara:strand:+ start:448 stop:711 length:264 start_codon:yes stop_codon:yes gene_type:complete
MKIKMKITNKKTGNSFNLSGKGAADFFYSKNANGEYINTLDKYSIDDNIEEILKKDNEIGQVKFFLCCFGLIALVLGSFLLHLHLNY